MLQSCIINASGVLTFAMDDKVKEASEFFFLIALIYIVSFVRIIVWSFMLSCSVLFGEGCK